MKAWRFFLTVALLLLVGAFAAFVELMANFTLMVPLAARPAFNPEQLGLPFERVEITSADHLRLVAWYCAATPVEGISRPPLIVVHGLGASKDFMLNHLMLAHRLGHPVLAIDLRGHGESAKSITTLGWLESRDITQWINFLESKGLSKPVLWGHSLGAASCILAASQDARTGGLIADAPFDTLRHTMAVHARLFFGLPEYPFVPLTYWRVGRKLGIDPDEINLIRAMKTVRCPSLFMTSENDARMPEAVVRPVFEAAPEPKTFWIIPQADHETRVFAPEYRAKVSEFLSGLK